MSTNQMGLHLLALFVPSILGVVHRYGQIGLDVMNIIKEGESALRVQQDITR